MNFIRKLLDPAEYILKQAPYIILILSVLASLVLWSYHYASYVFLVASVSVGSLTYIVLKRKFDPIDQNQTNVTFPIGSVNNLQNIFTILYFIFFGLSILTLTYGFYSKSLLYYVCISLCVGLIFIEIASSGQCQNPWWTLTKIFLLFLNLSLSNQVIFPYGIGNPDDFYHIYNILIPTLDTGHVPDGYTYSHFPCHQILAGIASLVSGIDPRMAYYCVGSLLMALGIIFVYIIGSKYLGEKYGLISALIYVCCDYIIYWASHPVQLSYTYPIALMIFSVVLWSILDRYSIGLGISFILLSLAMIFTHHYTATIVIFLIMLILFLEHFQKDELHSKKKIVLWFALAYLLILLCQWIYYSELFGGFVDIVESYVDIFLPTTSSSSVTASPTVYDAIPITTLFLNEIGSCILISLSTIGFLYCVNNRDKVNLIIVAVAMFFGGLIAAGVVINVYYLLPNRIYVFLQEYALIFLAGIAILWILSKNKGNLRMIAVIVSILVCLSFFSSASTIAGFETSLFTDDQPYWKFYETPYERYSCIWAEEYVGGNSIATAASPVCPSKNVSFEKYPIMETGDGFIPDISDMDEISYFQFSKFDISAGVLYKSVMKYHMGCKKRVKLSTDSERSFETLDKIYDNMMLSNYFRS